jgi:hypothetical protein
MSVPNNEFYIWVETFLPDHEDVYPGKCKQNVGTKLLIEVRNFIPVFASEKATSGLLNDVL